MSILVRVAPEVAEALADGGPVVALESTLVTHGLPHPEGVAAAAELEAAVRDAGATPATIGVIDGVLRVGLDHAALEQLATTPRVAKLNLSNLAAGIASGAPGSTTVASTLFAAARAGIAVFATGGIGGVHRDAERTGDVSVDLTALSRYPVAVVCAGAKAVLDLPRTVEMLETLGVPIFGFGTRTFPAFYRRDSGLPIDAGFDDLAGLAAAVRAHFMLGAGSGVVVANPIPAADELDREAYERALNDALVAADADRVKGRDVTPFLLDRLRRLTGGASVVANRSLLRHNATIAAGLACALVASRTQPEGRA